MDVHWVRESEQQRGKERKERGRDGEGSTSSCGRYSLLLVLLLLWRSTCFAAPFAAVLWQVLLRQQSLCAAGRQAGREECKRGRGSVCLVCCLSTLCALMHAMHKTVS